MKRDSARMALCRIYSLSRAAKMLACFALNSSCVYEKKFSKYKRTCKVSHIIKMRYKNEPVLPVWSENFG